MKYPKREKEAQEEQMVCLDSDVIIDFLRGDKETVKRIFEIKGSETLLTTSINSFEIIRGSIRLNYEKGISFINSLKILNFDFESSKKAAEIFEKLREKGESIDPLDLMIASVAIINNEPLITRNISHFSRIKELKILS